MTDEFELYKKAIARIYRSDGAVVGSGFLVFNHHVLTCAHVVAEALGIAGTTQGCLGDLVELDFPFPPSKQKPKFQARVVFWKPKSSFDPMKDLKYGEDIAALKLEKNLTEEISSGLVLEDYSHKSFEVFGFPIGHDNGVWTKGEVLRELANGQVQMNVLEQSDFYVEGGFSGAPVWIENLGVCGMVVAAEYAAIEERKKVKAAYMIPVEVLRKCWCDLEPCIKKPCILQTNIIPLPQSSVTQPSSNQKIAELLYSLDYSQQEHEFKSAIEKCQEGVFLVQTGEEKIQRWLVRRLAGCVPDFEQAKKISIKIRSHLRRDFDALLQEFKQDLGDNLSREKVIQGLAEFCKTKSVIIVIYGLSSLDAEKVSNFYAFWSNLVETVGSISRSFRSRLVLILVEENLATVPKKLLPFTFVHSSAINQTQYCFKLTPLENISQNDVRNWLAQEEVYRELDQTYDEVESIVDNDIPHWQEKPSEILDEICYTVFQLEDGIAAIEPYWKLAG